MKSSLPFDIRNGQSVPWKDSFLIVGGYSYDKGDYLDSILYYNPQTDAWDLMNQRMKKTRQRFTAFSVPKDFGSCVTNS